MSSSKYEFATRVKTDGLKANIGSDTKLMAVLLLGETENGSCILSGLSTLEKFE